MTMNGGTIVGKNLECGMVASIDAALVGMSASLAAESLGLRSVMIGVVRNNTIETSKILNLPIQVFCTFGMCLGWPNETPQQKPRMAQSAMIHHEQYGTHRGGQERVGMLNDYNQELAAHYASINKPTTADSLTHDIAKKFSPEPRVNLRQELKDQGFSLD
jgi:nitroreductase